MANASSNDSGFALPTPADVAAAASGVNAAVQQIEGAPPVAANTSSRDLMIGGGVLLVLFVAFFFAKNAYANVLVGQRVPPSKANASAWWLFVMLATVSTGVVLAAVNASKFMTPLIMAPIGSVSALSLVLMLVTGRK
jgi:hypothetical protein